MLDSILGFAGRIGGSFIDRESTRDTNNMTKELAQQNMALQREFAQSGIQWRVEDAKKAGIHPIYALGSAGASFSPVSANFASPPSVASDMAAAGQDIGRAINSTRTESQRADAFMKATQALTLERGQLENEILRADLASKTARLRQVPNPPMATAGDPYLISGQTQSGVKDQPMERVTSAPGRGHMEPGAITDVGFSRTPTGWAPIPSKDVKERIEDNIIQEVMWAWRNNILPNFNGGTPPPHLEGKPWVYDWLRQEYRGYDPNERFVSDAGRAKLNRYGRFLLRAITGK